MDLQLRQTGDKIGDPHTLRQVLDAAQYTNIYTVYPRRSRYRFPTCRNLKPPETSALADNHCMYRVRTGNTYVKQRQERQSQDGDIRSFAICFAMSPPFANHYSCTLAHGK